MKLIAYTFAFLGWLLAAIIFRYGLYPPQIMFWLVLVGMAFIAAGLSGDKWAGLKITAVVWCMLPLVQQIYPDNLPNLPSLVLYLLISLGVSASISLLASITKPKSVVKALAIITLVLVVVIASLYYSIEKTGSKTVINKADAAIILGAAVWEGGKPSPSMYARVKEGVKLYKGDFVEQLIVTGGLGRIPPTEAEVMAKLAKSLGVPKKDIILETKATTTVENLQYSKLLGKGQGFKTYIIVSDAFHLKRALLIADSLGIKAQGMPALESPLYTNKWLRFKYTLRETFALIKFYINPNNW